mmetsp:Transcript_21824/g.33567  ORF Transcript_21824/g.33567 Transcript_21824/m.33567 type:complete len:1664 (+) Transcript_21824:111-5102(+)|eukprot:CAMPEP_0197311984 /NCGR_PEP_ID=MMETSP0891-20130614/16229_1 /TAXON_ID=44058 ORGANISM="Aureoumbra lagunensis, Strain CCMP1510" /NCGR_SAMPLE_ID=MMETSP0891 /ASSEMBLY_ACC=CAM_ASM_000534 /LENGTH=1663 /DNA_ID=CAMNT_0042798729 /DNA_START=29 /DNA_END=5023 /DNA_ORIENTATION=+
MSVGFDQGWEKGGSVFVNDDEEGWVEATIVKIEGVGRAATLTVKLKESGKMQRREANEVEQASQLSLSGVEDMTTLDDLTEATVLSTLRSRYQRKEIYTNVGGILIAVNPYEKLSETVYGDECMFAYGGADVAFTGCAPHPYLLAEAALRALDRDRESQSFVISGESGSGKTETCKYVLRYLSYRSKRRYEHSVSHAESDKRTSQLEESVLLSNPILESFGNAKTNRNDNSSRWGKYTQVFVEPSSGAIERVGMTAYLLEKVRVVERSKGERNYHILYQMVTGISADDPIRTEIGPHIGTNGTDHAVLRDGAGGVKNPKDVDDRTTSKNTREALRVLNIDEKLAFNALAAVCHLLDLVFKDIEDTSGSEGSKVDTHDLFQGKNHSIPALQAAALALGVDQKELSEALISRRVAGVRAPRTAAEADIANQAFAKALYSRLFDWILVRVNQALKALTSAAPTKLSKEMFMEDLTPKKSELLTIGLLDIFGFEQFVVNSLEQLLINYANERLLREFNKQVFEAATKEYQAEGVPVGDLTFHDNSALLHTLENPRGGVFAMLNSECVRRDGSDPNFLASLLKAYNLKGGGQSSPVPKSKQIQAHHGLYVPKVGRGSSQVERDSVGLVFGVRHFAADVSYTVTGFVEKNRDRVPDEICALVATSSRGFIASLFADVDENENDESASGTGSKTPPKKGKGLSPGKSSKARRYVAANFAQSLSDLTQLLDATNQSFVRCIKPNHKMMSGMFEGVVVLDQLRCMGMLELVEARRRGYARRIDHATFVSRYALLMEDQNDGETDKDKDGTRGSYASSIMAMVAGDDKDQKKNGRQSLSIIQQWEAKPGTPATSKEFIRAIKPRMKHPQALEHMAVGKTKVFLKKEALDELESAREDRLRHDVLLALKEATENRDALQLELTLRIADELRLGETDEARLARATLTDERAYQEIFHATIEACETVKSSKIDECLTSHNISISGEGDLDSLKKQASGKNGNDDLPFSSGQWFSGSSWSKYVLDAARVGRLARDITILLTKLIEDPTKSDLADAKILTSASNQECKRYAKIKDDEDQRAPAVDALEKVTKQVQESIAKAEAKMEIAAALRAIRAATSAYDLSKLTAGLAAFDKIPPQRSGPLMTEKDEDTISAARACIKQLTSISKLDAETDKLKKEISSDKKAKAFATASTAPARIGKYDELIADVENVNGKAPPQAGKSLNEAKTLSAKLKQLIEQHQPKAAAVIPPQSAEDAQAKKAVEQKKEAEKIEERNKIEARREAREKQQSEDAEKERKAKAAARNGPPEGEEMQNMSSAERAAIQAEENKRLAQRAPLFFELEWSERVGILTKGSRMLKLSSTSSVQGAEWKHVRLETAIDGNGESLLASDPFCKNPQARSGAFLTWPSNTMLRRGSRKLQLSSITGIHVGTNAKQWCTMVPTEWHYMTLTTHDRSYDFGFESAALLLLWVNTLQRIIFPQWTRSCDAGQMSELFKGAISDAQHRFYRSSRAGASPSEAFKPSLPELCPVLYPFAQPIAKTCGELGVSFAAEAERAQKFCMWTAVAVLEAPVPHDQAVSAMRAVLSDLGFYAEGRFACSAGFYDENGLAHTLAKDAISASSLGDGATQEGGMLVIRAQHAKTGKVSVLKIKKGTKMASVFEAHAKHKGLRTQALSVVK